MKREHDTDAKPESRAAYLVTYDHATPEGMRRWREAVALNDARRQATLDRGPGAKPRVRIAAAAVHVPDADEVV